ncbi:MAG: hypothetical protein H6619_04195 [Deltaproteobacteria bacterium]|nr:hypothetical protein [Deltaproteobacteria bacterium]
MQDTVIASAEDVDEGGVGLVEAGLEDVEKVFGTFEAATVATADDITPNDLLKTEHGLVRITATELNETTDPFTHDIEYLLYKEDGSLEAGQMSLGSDELVQRVFTAPAAVSVNDNFPLRSLADLQPGDICFVSFTGQESDIELVEIKEVGELGDDSVALKFVTHGKPSAAEADADLSEGSEPTDYELKKDNIGFFKRVIRAGVEGVDVGESKRTEAKVDRTVREIENVGDLKTGNIIVVTKDGGREVESTVLGTIASKECTYVTALQKGSDGKDRLGLIRASNKTLKSDQVRVLVGINPRELAKFKSHQPHTKTRGLIPVDNSAIEAGKFTIAGLRHGDVIASKDGRLFFVQETRVIGGGRDEGKVRMFVSEISGRRARPQVLMFDPQDRPVADGDKREHISNYDIAWVTREKSPGFKFSDQSRTVVIDNLTDLRAGDRIERGPISGIVQAVHTRDTQPPFAVREKPQVVVVGRKTLNGQLETFAFSAQNEAGRGLTVHRGMSTGLSHRGKFDLVNSATDTKLSQGILDSLPAGAFVRLKDGRLYEVDAQVSAAGIRGNLYDAIRRRGIEAPELIEQARINRARDGMEGAPRYRAPRIVQLQVSFNLANVLSVHLPKQAEARTSAAATAADVAAALKQAQNGGAEDTPAGA